MIKLLVPLAGIIGGLALVALSVFADTGASVSGMAVGGIVAGLSVGAWWGASRYED